MGGDACILTGGRGAVGSPLARAKFSHTAYSRLEEELEGGMVVPLHGGLEKDGRIKGGGAMGRGVEICEL